MKYRISAVDKDATLKTVVDEISEKDYKTIMSNIRRLQVSMLSKDYYVIVRDNIKELLAFLPTIEMMNKYSIDTINRYTYNVLGTFYAWIEYYESHYKKIFEPFKKKYYDENFEYRMMYNLRIYMTHCEMAITQIEFWPGKSEIYIYIEPEILLQNSSRLQKNIIKDLQQMYDDNKKIDLYDLMVRFEKIFTSMHKELLKALEPELKKVLNDLNPYLQFTSEGKIKSCYIYEKETDKCVYSLTTFIETFINKMCNPY
ncbi:hypothetical protein DWY01_10175 [Eubacterium sp. AF22-8LB]|uniref:hypothetical protein n=3 Tax=Bacillota TaxID=1239 RepID=UPI000E48F992|nr:hypothetical protein [Eubacterium sp. AF22-8LB]RGS29174.1 hypothetical protein DWY01_10175 [Eubacterium sp. AF22-8LB]